ncbi:MAG: MBL fold metallo-hydrolase [Bacillota bacterium]|nr:MBL fold metallo-hydrolase [Bacillota bacterium]
MIIKVIPVGPLEVNCYVLMDEETKETLILDPGGDASKITKAVEDLNGQVKLILFTHGHIDHIGAAAELKSKYNVPIYINEKDDKLIAEGIVVYSSLYQDGAIDKNLFIDGNCAFGDKASNIHVEDNQIIKLGSLEMKCLETPGHTPGGMCFIVDKYVFTGDTLFQSSIGRTDFPGGDFSTLISSIKDKLMPLQDDVTVFPGHGPKSSIGFERKNNPYL